MVVTESVVVVSASRPSHNFQSIYIRLFPRSPVEKEHDSAEEDCLTVHPVSQEGKVM